MPPRKLTGTNTAHNTNDVAISALLIFDIAFCVALYADRCSSFIILSTLSTTTIASSTTIPIARIRPSRVIRLSEKPKISITPNVPISEIGTAIIGIIVDLQFCNDRYTTKITSSNASKSVLYTSLIDCEIYVVISKGIEYVMPSGRLRPISSIASFTFSATSIAFEPGSIFTFITAALPPSIPLSVEYDCASSEMRATSLRRIIEPSGFARTTICSNSSTDDSLPGAAIGIVTSTSSIGACPRIPAADSRFWSLIALCKSLTVRPISVSLSGITHTRIA